MTARDTDADTLNQKASLLAAGVFALVTEAVRVRDENLERLDKLQAQVAAVISERDSARRDYQALAVAYRDQTNTNAAPQVRYLRRVVERVEQALAADVRPDLPPDWVVTLMALGESAPRHPPDRPAGDAS